MNDSAEQEISRREQRMANVDAKLAEAAWLRELTNEITRLRYELRQSRESAKD